MMTSFEIERRVRGKIARIMSDSRHGVYVANALVAVSCALSSGCSGSAESESPTRPAGVLPELEIVPTPAGGIALYTPIIEDIQPGSDVTYCTFTDHVTDSDLFIHTTQGSQSSMGHHSLMFYTQEPEEPHTAPCGGQAMEKLRQILGGGGGEGTSVWIPPDNVGVLVPAGSQLVIQTHWINVAPEPVDVQAMMVTLPGTDSPDRIAAGTMTVLDLLFEVPAGAQAETTTQCVFDKDYRMMMTIGHEHEWGTHVRADVTRLSGETQLLFDRPFTPHDVFEPPVDAYPVENALLLAAGDTLQLTCAWDNTTGEALAFPREMCVFFGYTLESGDARCINGSWIGAGGGGTALQGPPCAAEGAPGNENGVGKYCTAAGGECASNGAASICLADYTTGEFGNFCTKLCADDTDCGTGAVCTGSDPQAATKACIPSECVSSMTP